MRQNRLINSFVYASGGADGLRRAYTLDRGQRNDRYTRVATFLALLLFVTGCDRTDDADAPGLAEVATGAYAGTFPCDGCPGIPTRLWLRGDGVYFLEQHYPRNDGSSEAVTSLGRWSRAGDDGELELRGEGPLRRFSRQGADALIMQTASPLEHRLVRDPTLGDFDGGVVVEGTITPGRDESIFAECLTGQRLTLARRADYATFARQYRRFGANGAPVFVEFEGKFRWRADGSPEAIEILRFVTIRSDGSC